jgi:hypothetical protein
MQVGGYSDFFTSFYVLAGQTVNFAYYNVSLQHLLEKCKEFDPNLAIKELAVASQQHAVSHLTGEFVIFGQKQHDRHPPPTYFSVSFIEDKTERPPC